MALIGLGKLAIPCMSVCFFLRVVLLTDKHRKQTYGCQGGSTGKGWFGKSRCNLLCIEQINNKILCYSTGSYIQWEGRIILETVKSDTIICNCVYIHLLQLYQHLDNLQFHVSWLPEKVVDSQEIPEVADFSFCNCWGSEGDTFPVHCNSITILVTSLNV